MKNTIKSVLVLGVSIAVQLSQAEQLMYTNFEQIAPGTAATRDVWKTEGFTTADWDEGLATRTIVTDSVAASGNHAWKVTYPQGKFGTDGTGCQVPLLFDKRDEAYMSYSLMFSENFSWGTTNYGGKLPGLAGGASCSGGAMCDGTNGWSARLMWRTGGKLVLYLYDMVKTEEYGEDHQLYYADGSPVVAERGKWYHIAERVKMNSTPDSKDGEVQIWVNGKEVLFLDGRQFTSNEDKIDKLYISTFHGGNNDGWCPTETCHTFFDDICIGTEYDDVCYTTCRKPELGMSQSLCADKGAATLTCPLNNTTHKWYCNGKLVSEEHELETTTPGTYILVADSGRCSQKDTIAVTATLEAQIEKEVHICEKSFTQLNAGIKADEGITFVWEKDGNLIEGANQPTLITKDAGTYNVNISSNRCKPTKNQIVVSTGLLDVDDVDGWTGETVSLQTKTEGSYNWTNEDGEPIGSGNKIDIELQEGEHYAYVKDANGFSGNVGKKELSENAWTRKNFDTEYMTFTVKRELTIDSISIYPTQPLDATIRIVNDETNDVVFSRIYSNLPGGGEARLAIGSTLAAGNYHVDAQGTTAPLYHSHTDPDIHFPYSIDGLIDINGCNLAWINNKGWYMLFYNWHVSTGNHCAATPVKMVGRNPNHEKKNKSECGISVVTYNNTLLVKGLKTNSVLTLVNANGQQVLLMETPNNEEQLSTQHLPQGVYVLNVKTDGQQYSTNVIVK